MLFVEEVQSRAIATAEQGRSRIVTHEKLLKSDEDYISWTALIERFNEVDDLIGAEVLSLNNQGNLDALIPRRAGIRKELDRLQEKLSEGKLEKYTEIFTNYRQQLDAVPANTFVPFRKSFNDLAMAHVIQVAAKMTAVAESKGDTLSLFYT